MNTLSIKRVNLSYAVEQVVSYECSDATEKLTIYRWTEESGLAGLVTLGLA